jgi:heat shock protein HslJ
MGNSVPSGSVEFEAHPAAVTKQNKLRQINIRFKRQPPARQDFKLHAFRQWHFSGAAIVNRFSGVVELSPGGPSARSCFRG